MSVEDKARAAIARYAMLEASDCVVVGISGGADSVALLHFLAALRGEFSIKLVAAHLNHMLRGDESERDERFVRELCDELNIELRSCSENVAGLAANCGVSLEEAGRKARYGFFEELAKGRGTRIATAHTLNDSVETAVLNLARGTALRGICGIPPVRGKIIRPLILCERREIEEYCRDNGLGYVTDSSNLSDDFARNRIRKYVLPVLSGINPGFPGIAAGTLEALRADADYLDEAAERAFASIRFGGEASGLYRYRRAEYLGHDRAIRFRILLRLLSQYGVYADSRRLARLDSAIEAGSGAEQLSDEIYLKAYKRFFYIGPARREREYFCVRADMPGLGEIADVDVFSDKKIRLMSADYEYYEENIKYDEKLLKNSLDCDKINKIANIRQKIPGDAVRLQGRGCTKTLKKLFQEAWIPPEERGGFFVLSDSEGPVWVEGFGVAERAAVTADTKRVLILDVLIGGAGDAE